MREMREASLASEAAARAATERAASLHRELEQEQKNYQALEVSCTGTSLPRFVV